MDDDVYPPVEVECSKVTIYDGYQTNGPSIDSTSLRIDDTVDTVDDPAINWMKDDERISKDCRISSRDETRVICDSLNIGFERNFRTDNYMQDIQLSAALAGQEFPVFGWIYDSGRFWTVTKYRGNNIAQKREDLAQIKVVSKAYVDELRTLGVNVDEEIPLFVIPVEEDYQEESADDAQKKDDARSL